MKRTARWYIVVGAGVVVLVAIVTFVVNLLARSSDNLAGSAWRLTMLNGHAPLNTSEPVSLSFEAGQRAGGNSGCNLYGGSYTIAGSSLTIGEINSTLRACAEQALNDQEAEYYQALQAVAAYELANDQLILKDVSGAVLLIFTRA